jgi:hypothetical protein
MKKRCFIFNAEILFFRDGPNGSFIFEQEDGTVTPSAPLRERTEDTKRREHKETERTEDAKRREQKDTSSRTRTRRTEHKENIATG